jgi:hypothetical protein
LDFSCDCQIFSTVCGERLIFSFSKQHYCKKKWDYKT